MLSDDKSLFLGEGWGIAVDKVSSVFFSRDLIEGVLETIKKTIKDVRLKYGVPYVTYCVKLALIYLKPFRMLILYPMIPRRVGTLLIYIYILPEGDSLRDCGVVGMDI